MADDFEEENEGSSPPDSPEKGPVDSDALDQSMDDMLAQMEASEPEATEQPEQQAETTDYGISEVEQHLDQTLTSLPDDQELPPEATGSVQELDAGIEAPDSEAAGDPPESLLKYLQKQADQLGGQGSDSELPSGLPQPEEEEALDLTPLWASVLGGQSSQNEIMRDMLVEHEQAGADNLRRLESARW